MTPMSSPGPTKIVRFLLFLWQLPQNIAGLSVLAFYRVLCLPIQKYEEGVYLVDQFCAGGVCLGEYIFIHSPGNTERARRHEKGHRTQSRILGPLYLLIVGLPSATLNILSHFSPGICRSYYEIFPENWADRLGGVFKLK